MAHRDKRRGKAWLYVVDGRNSHDLALLDAFGFDTWRGNPETRAGDLILMYRTKPYSDIAYVFRARSDARQTEITARWPWRCAVDIADGFRLPRVLTLDELRAEPSLTGWPFLRHQRGVTDWRRDLREQGWWQPLRRILERRAPSIPQHFGRAWVGLGERRRIFLSYASPDRSRVRRLYLVLTTRGLDPWLDRVDLSPGMAWDKTIVEALESSRVAVVCLSRAWLRARGYVRKEADIATRLASEGRMHVVPVLLERCKVPPPLNQFQAMSLGPHTRSTIDRLAEHIRELAIT